MFSKILAPIITPNANDEFKYNIFKNIYTTIPSANHQTSPIQRDKGWYSIL
jgi:hypothetical protein